MGFMVCIGPYLDTLELCSGPKANLTTAFYNEGLNSLPMDIRRAGAFDDILSVYGVQNFLTQMGKVRTGGLWWVGPPCNSWIMTSQSYYGRTRNNARGNINHAETLYYNAIADFIAMAIDAAVALAIFCH